MISRYCEECDTIWENKIDNQTRVNFNAYMQNNGYKASWDEVEIE